MGAYDTMDEAIDGLKSDLNSRVESWSANEEINFGEGLFALPGEEIKCSPFYNDTGALVFSADLITLNSTIVTVNGVAATAVVFDTDHDTTMDLLVVAINALAGVEAVLSTTDANNRTILIRTQYATAVTSAVVTAGGSQATASATYASSMVFIGIALFTQKENGLYAEDDAVNVLTEGKVWMTVSGAVVANLPAYISASGWNASSGFDTGCIFRTNAANAARALIEVKEPKVGTYSTIDFA